MSRVINGVDASEEIVEARKFVENLRRLLVDALGQAHRLSAGSYDTCCNDISEPLVAMAEELRQLGFTIDNLETVEQHRVDERPQSMVAGGVA